MPFGPGRVWSNRLVRAVVEVRPADSSGVTRIAGVLGRAFVTELMMMWPLGGRSDDLECSVSPDQTNVWDDALTHVDDSTTHDVTDDGGLRHERFWGVGRLEGPARAVLAPRLRGGRARLAAQRAALSASDYTSSKKLTHPMGPVCLVHAPRPLVRRDLVEELSEPGLTDCADAGPHSHRTCWTT